MSKNFDDFIRINEQELTKYFRSIYAMFENKHVNLQDGGTVLYPNLLLVSETKQHYICEVLGITNKFSGLNKRIHKESSTYNYLAQSCEKDEVKHEPLLFVDSQGSELSKLLLSNGYDGEEIKNRFKFSPEEIWGTHLLRQDGVGSILKFGEKFKSIYINDCCIINKVQKIYRMKQISLLIVINKKMNLKEFRKELENKLTKPIKTTDDLYGIKYCVNENDLRKYNIVQFANVYLTPNIHETTIGEYIKNNPEIIVKALGYESMLYEPEFEWIEGGIDDEKKINPDIMLRDREGLYDILDLKRPKMEKKSITKAQHKRRRFIDYVQEGISQLANYAEYFKYEKNIEYAFKEKGVKVRGNPKLILIVGNFENYNIDEVREACRCLKSNYEIIDFDTLNTMIYAKLLK